MSQLQTYDELIAASKNAHNAGDTVSAQRFYDRAQQSKSLSSGDNLRELVYEGDGIKIHQDPQSQLSLSSPSFFTSNQEDIKRFIKGEVTLPQIAKGVMPKQGMEIPAALGTGLLRGVKGLLETPETIGSLGRMGYEYLTGKDVQPFPEETLAGSTFEKGLKSTTGITSDQIDYRSPNTIEKYVGTVGEFLPAAVGGAAGLAKRAAIATTAGVGSEAAGQAAEGTGYEPYARMSGALFAPWLGTKTLKTGNKTVNYLLGKSGETPSVENLRKAKNMAYNAVDDSDIKFSAQEVDDFILEAVGKVENLDGYVPEVDTQTRAAVNILLKKAGGELTFGDLDKIRQNLHGRLATAPNEIGLSSMIDDIDELIASNTSSNVLVKAARTANARYKKSELLENSLNKAERQAQASGTGGNLVNKYRQAVNNIISNPKQAKFFSKDEVAFMDRFVRGDVEENILRLMGRLSPNANGLMAAINVGLVAYNPALLPISVAGLAGKSAGEARSTQLVNQIQKMIATGVPPQEAASISNDIARIILGSQASLNAEEAQPQGLVPIIQDMIKEQ